VKSSQNSRQAAKGKNINIKAQFIKPQHLHQASFGNKKTMNYVLKLLIFAEIKKRLN